MDRASVSQHAPAPSPETANALLDRIEQEIDRLKRHRPQLKARITKASNILVAHLAGRPAMPVVRVRISKTGRPRFLFSSLTGNGATYVVDANTWTCSCPAAHRYEGPCKHGLAAWVLWRVSLHEEAA